MENFEKIQKIGQGNFGDVLLVKRKSDNKLFALKRVPYYQDCEDNSISSLEQGDQEKKKLDNEVRVIKSLQHTNIIKYHESFLHNYHMCILMDYADCGDLQKKINEAKKSDEYISEQQIVFWFAQICLAIRYLYKNKILHRDIKAQNIFLTKTGLIKVGDFGISKQLENTGDLAKTSLGTPYYLSPEICSNKPYDHKSDMWMLGCLLHELCSLQKPFNGDSLHGVVNSILRNDYNNVPVHYSQFIHKTIRSLLQKNPESRASIEQIIVQPEILNEIKKLKEIYPEEYLNLDIQEITISSLNKISLIKSNSQEISQHKPKIYQNLQTDCSTIDEIENEITKSEVVSSKQKKSEEGNQSYITPKSQTDQQNYIKTSSTVKKEKLAQNNIHYLIKKAKESQSPLGMPNKNTKFQLNSDFIQYQESSNNNIQQMKMQVQSGSQMSSRGNSQNKKPIESDQQQQQQQQQQYLDEYLEIITREEEQRKKSYQRDIQINTVGLEPFYKNQINQQGGGGNVNGPQLNSLESNTTQATEDENDNQAESNRIPKKTFSFGDKIFHPDGPGSPNRSVLFIEFLKQRLGLAKYVQIENWLSSVANPIQALDEQSKFILDILGDDGMQYVKIFKYIITNTLTPGHSRTKSLSILENLQNAKIKERKEHKTTINIIEDITTHEHKNYSNTDAQSIHKKN